MTHAQIEQLLAKFMDGHTTIDEEAQLTSFFRNEDVPAQWEDYRDMFAYIEEGCPAEAIAPKRQHRLLRYRGSIGWACAVAAVVVALVIHTHIPPTSENAPSCVRSKDATLSCVRGRDAAPPLAQNVANNAGAPIHTTTTRARPGQNKCTATTGDAPETTCMIPSHEEEHEAVLCMEIPPTLDVEAEPLVAGVTTRPLTEDELIDIKLTQMTLRVANMEDAGNALLDHNDYMTGTLTIETETINP